MTIQPAERAPAGDRGRWAAAHENEPTLDESAEQKHNARGSFRARAVEQLVGRERRGVFRKIIDPVMLELIRAVLAAGQRACHQNGGI